VETAYLQNAVHFKILGFYGNIDSQCDLRGTVLTGRWVQLLRRNILPCKRKHCVPRKLSAIHKEVESSSETLATVYKAEE